MKQSARNSDVESPVKEVMPMPPDAFKAEMAARGWDALMLSQRWGMSKRRVQQIASDADRPRYYDDALRGLPTLLLLAK